MEEEAKNLIEVNKFVILVDNRGEKRLIKPSDHKNFKWRKQPLKLVQLNKFEYYQTIEVGNDTLKPVEQQSFGEESEQDEFNEGQNNKQIYTLEQAQKLKADEINKMKASKEGAEIIEAIVTNNQQFEKRTLYSKEKYLAKKKKKYLFRFHVEPTTLDTVQQYYFDTELKSIGGIRSDIFGFLLLQGSPFKRVFLAEQTKGLFLASMLIKQAQTISVYSEQQKSIKRFPIVEQMNIPKQETEGKIQFKTWQGLQQQKQTFSNVIMSGNYDFVDILKKVYANLQPGCVICLFSHHMELLQEALSWMLDHANMVHVKLYDSWARVYQVLKNRTHPNMYMHSNPGYVLVGFVVK